MSITPGPSLLSLPRFNEIPRLVHGFGTRSWKLADFRRAAPWNLFKLIIMDQVHSDIVHIVSTVPARKLRGDGLITSLPGVFLTIKTADCLPVFMVDEKQRVVGAVHCGWRGTQQRILG